MAINRFVVLALFFVAMVAYASAADTAAEAVTDAAASVAAPGGPLDGGVAGSPDAAAGGPTIGGGTSSAAPAGGDATSFKASTVTGVVGIIVATGLFF